MQEYTKGLIVEELKQKLGTDLGIEKLYFLPFNTIELKNVYLYDQSAEKVLVANHVSAGVDIFSLISGKIVITSAWLTDFEAHLSKQTSDSPLNIQYIIDAFKSKNDKPKSKLDIKLNSINISNGKLSWDIKDKPEIVNSFDANHIEISELNAKLAVKSILEDSLNIQVKRFGFKEKSGLELTNMVFRLVTQGKKASVRGFKLYMPSSYLELNKCELDLTSPNDSLKLLDYASLDLKMAPSRISPKDIRALTPSLQYFNDVINIETKISGSIDNLNIENLTLSYGKSTHLISSIEVKDMRDKEKMYLLGSINELTISSQEIESLVNNFSKNEIKLPSQLSSLGTVSFEGDISGYLNQLTAFGSFDTNLGIIKTDVLFGLNPRKGLNYYAQGKVYTSDLKIGKLLSNNQMDKISLNLSVNLEKPTYGKIKGSADVSIHDFDFKGYRYQEITLAAKYDGMHIDGEAKLNDPNANVAIKGLFDLSDKNNPELNFEARVKDVQLDKLHIAEKMQHSYLSFNADADFIGNNLDNAIGFIKVDSLDFMRADKALFMDSLRINITGTQEDKRLKISSNILNGEVNGMFSFSSLLNSFQQTLHPYLPSIIKASNKTINNDTENSLAFDFKINNTESLSDIFNLPVTVYSQAKVMGQYNSVNDKFNLEIFAPSVKTAGMKIESGYVSVKNPNNTIDAKIDMLVQGKKNTVNNISIDSKLNEDRINTNISLLNTGQQKAKGSFSINTHFSKAENDPLRIDVDLLPGELLLNNSTWKIEESHISTQNGTVDVKNFTISNTIGNQEVKINGKYSKNPHDILKAELKNINLEYIFQTLAIDALQFGGAATGSLFVSTVEGKPYANTRLGISDFKFNNAELGQLNLFSELDEETNMVVLDGLIKSKENKDTKVNGTLDPINQKLSIYFDADSINLGFLNKYAQTLFDDIRGHGTGNVHLYGDFSNVTVEGKAFINEASMGIKFLNTRYSFSDSIFMKKDLIYFNDLTLTDEFNNKARVNGKVAHDRFNNFMYQVDLSADKFLVYNATQQHNPLFYGRVFGSGKGTISGDESAVDIDISMRTEGNTAVKLNFMDEVVNEYSFITYKSPKETIDTLKTLENTMPAPIKTESGMAINMNFYIDATPDAIVELVMDPVGGDVLRGSGSGAMQFQWGTKTSPRLFGTYHISRGSYNFTFQRIMERRFNIQEGSTVQFRGDPFEAILDVNAIYKVNASLNDLDKELVRSTGQTTIPVNCVLNLTSALRRPTVKLDITFPSTDPEVERQIKSIINTEDMINRQIAFLLIFSKFKAPHDANVDNPTSDFAALASATLSNQLTKIVSNIDDRWQLGTNIRYDDRELTYTEAELLLSSQLLNDRLIINGNFGYRNDLAVNKEAMITDVDIEYLLNNAGTWRIKAYNHYNEKYYYTNSASRTDKATQTQGFGIIYKKDFDSLMDIFRKPRLRSKRVPTPVLPSISDTIKPVSDSIKPDNGLSHFIKLKK